LSTVPSGDHAETQAASDRTPGADEIFDALISTVHAMVRYGNARLGECQGEGRKDGVSHGESTLALPGKISGPRLRVLKALMEGGSLRMGDLAVQLGVKPRTITDLVDGLEREGLVVRRPDASDRRVTRLELTPELRQRWEPLRERFEEIGEEVLSPLGVAERRQLLDLLLRVKAGPIGRMARNRAHEVEMLLQGLVGDT
jgi:DNA-binding MarR family transcriptional regulator